NAVYCFRVTLELGNQFVRLGIPQSRDSVLTSCGQILLPLTGAKHDAIDLAPVGDRDWQRRWWNEGPNIGKLVGPHARQVNTAGAKRDIGTSYFLICFEIPNSDKLV